MSGGYNETDKLMPKSLIFRVLVFSFLSTFLLYAQNPGELLNEIKKLISSKQYSEAIGMSLKLLEEFPKSEETKSVCLILPGCYEKIGEIDQIEKIYLFAIEHFQDDIAYADKIKQLLSEYYIKTDNLNQAIETYNGIKNKNYGQAIAFYERIEKIYQQQGKYKEAGDLKLKIVDIYSEIVENCAKDTELARYHRYKPGTDREYTKARQMRQAGMYYEKAGESGLAETIYFQLIETYPDTPFSIIPMYILAGRYSDRDLKRCIPLYINAIKKSTRPFLLFKAKTKENQQFIDEYNNEKLTPQQIAETIARFYKAYGLETQEEEIKEKIKKHMRT